MNSLAEHKVITLDVDSVASFLEHRYNAVQQIPNGDYFCFVDDDDIVEENSFINCVQALEMTNAQLAFTNERKVDNYGNVKYSSAIRSIDYEEITFHPRSIHHLTVMKKSVIGNDAYSLSLKYGQGYEWFLKAELGLKGGAIHIPYVGYSWRQHNNNFSHRKEWERPFIENMVEMTKDLKKWQSYHGKIPFWYPK